MKHGPQTKCVGIDMFEDNMQCEELIKLETIEWGRVVVRGVRIRAEECAEMVWM